MKIKYISPVVFMVTLWSIPTLEKYTPESYEVPTVVTVILILFVSLASSVCAWAEDK